MDRRTLLTLAAASLPALAAAPAIACSVALKSPRTSGIQNQQVLVLFDAWWERDAAKFRASFTNPLKEDDPELARELLALDPIPEDTYAIFDRFFTGERKLRRVTLMVNTDAGVVVACSEADASPNIQPDCTGIPTLHLFLVTMRGLSPRSVVHLASTETVEVDKFSIWTEGSGLT